MTQIDDDVAGGGEVIGRVGRRQSRRPPRVPVRKPGQGRTPGLRSTAIRLTAAGRAGGAHVMFEQVTRLTEAAKRPHVMIQVIPASVGAHEGLLGHFVIADFLT